LFEHRAEIDAFHRRFLISHLTHRDTPRLAVKRFLDTVKELTGDAMMTGKKRQVESEIEAEIGLGAQPDSQSREKLKNLPFQID
jgi:hypothetical protein